MKRIAVLGLGHETNTFSNDLATESLYADGGIQRGDEIIEVHSQSQSTYAGFLAPLARSDVELVPLLAAWTNPRGRIQTRAFDSLLSEMTSLLESRGDWDAILLNLHGAAVAEHVEEADLRICQAVHALSGGAPIGLVVDMHANLSPGIAELVDVLMPYQTNPHVDPAKRGLACRNEVLRILDGKPRPAVHIESIPLVVNIVKQDTGEEPMRGLLAQAKSIASREGALDVSILEGFPYADVKQMGMSVSVTHPSGLGAAQRAARSMAEAVWRARRELQGVGMGIQTALDESDSRRPGDPVLLLDVGDNVGGGGPGDTTHLLAAAIARGSRDLVFTIQDPVAALRLATADIGSHVSVPVGGWSSVQAGEPVELVGELISATDGIYEEPVVAHGGLRHFDTGTSVAVKTLDGLVIVVTSKLVQPVSMMQLTSHGIDPAALRGIVAKGVNGPRAGFASHTRGHVVVDTPGITRLSIEGLPYRRRASPMYPFEHTEFDTERRTDA
ncbi:M81 family metallopeptidase [Microbacterium sp. NPDC087592]|uniref:M81 family metallopeptidase n=1 Tax=Microbacterium sp. NPDC087592 TaxID=3364193 RepID=UPI003818A405